MTGPGHLKMVLMPLMMVPPVLTMEVTVANKQSPLRGFWGLIWSRRLESKISSHIFFWGTAQLDMCLFVIGHVTFCFWEFYLLISQPRFARAMMWCTQWMQRPLRSFLVRLIFRKCLNHQNFQYWILTSNTIYWLEAKNDLFQISFFGSNHICQTKIETVTETRFSSESLQVTCDPILSLENNLQVLIACVSASPASNPRLNQCMWYHVAHLLVASSIVSLWMNCYLSQFGNWVRALAMFQKQTRSWILSEVFFHFHFYGLFFIFFLDLPACMPLTCIRASSTVDVMVDFLRRQDPQTATVTEMFPDDRTMKILVDKGFVEHLEGDRYQIQEKMLNSVIPAQMYANPVDASKYRTEARFGSFATVLCMILKYYIFIYLYIFIYYIIIYVLYIHYLFVVLHRTGHEGHLTLTLTSAALIRLPQLLKCLQWSCCLLSWIPGGLNNASKNQENFVLSHSSQTNWSSTMQLARAEDCIVSISWLFLTARAFLRRATLRFTIFNLKSITKRSSIVSPVLLAPSCQTDQLLNTRDWSRVMTVTLMLIAVSRQEGCWTMMLKVLWSFFLSENTVVRVSANKYFENTVESFKH